MRRRTCSNRHAKAGANAIQEHGDLIVSEISGSYSNVVGFPLEKLKEELQILQT
jgi:predicted house-cleaning NTP pyrophosphatase (Maf/HAM1 superfamily)